MRPTPECRQARGRAPDLELSVSRNLRYLASLHGMARHAAKERMEAELGRLDMLDRADDKVRQLSDGGRRRVEIVRSRAAPRRPVTVTRA